mmetsp:Transcript_27863/g.42461  ORF Transcript_27863/g.42461 Transcript_27863/m.42461 type:complete len:235 (+) Transcript_27863:208-912(+)
MTHTDNYHLKSLLATTHQPLRSMALSDLRKDLQSRNTLSALYLRSLQRSKLSQWDLVNHFLGLHPPSLLLQQATLQSPLTQPQSSGFGFEKNASSLAKNPDIDYIDYARFRAPSLPDTSRNKENIYTKNSTFTMKLYHILQDRELSHCIAWMPHGRSWKILDHDEFEKVLPRFFRHAKTSSFMRQVNGWGFQRVPDRLGDGYYHEVSCNYCIFKTSSMMLNSYECFSFIVYRCF